MTCVCHDSFLLRMLLLFLFFSIFARPLNPPPLLVFFVVGGSHCSLYACVISSSRVYKRPRGLLLSLFSHTTVNWY